MSEPTIRVQGLGKRYQIVRQERYQALRDRVGAALRRPFQRQADERHGAFWALQDVSFNVLRGEVLGIIGPNGTGKTTLLKILSRITAPTAGRAEIRGRIGSLLEVGTGFHPELTGRENIYLNGVILGMRRREIERKFDEIIEFSGVAPFLDTPVKRYSTGMQVRLAFSVAAHLEPEILLVDEVLAVGDAAFQQKCLGKLNQVASSGRTVLFVSHNMSAIRRLCTSALWLKAGRVERCDRRVNDVIDAYLGDVQAPGAHGIVDLTGRTDRGGSGIARITSLEVRVEGGQGAALQTGAGAEFIISYASAARLTSLQVILVVKDRFGDNVFMCMPALTPLKELRDMPPRGMVTCALPSLPLVPGRYAIDVWLKDGAGVGALADTMTNAATFDVIDGGKSGLESVASDRWGKVLVPQAWSWVDAEVEVER